MRSLRLCVDPCCHICASVACCFAAFFLLLCAPDGSFQLCILRMLVAVAIGNVLGVWRMACLVLHPCSRMAHLIAVFRGGSLLLNLRWRPLSVGGILQAPSVAPALWALLWTVRVLTATANNQGAVCHSRSTRPLVTAGHLRAHPVSATSDALCATVCAIVSEFRVPPLARYVPYLLSYAIAAYPLSLFM